MLSEIAHATASFEDDQAAALLGGGSGGGAGLYTVARFGGNNNVGWGYSGSRDSICVTVGQRIYVHGLGLFGDNKESVFNVDLCICTGNACVAWRGVG